MKSESGCRLAMTSQPFSHWVPRTTILVIVLFVTNVVFTKSIFRKITLHIGCFKLLWILKDQKRHRENQKCTLRTLYQLIKGLVLHVILINFFHSTTREDYPVVLAALWRELIKVSWSWRKKEQISGKAQKMENNYVWVCVCEVCLFKYCKWGLSSKVICLTWFYIVHSNVDKS